MQPYGHAELFAALVGILCVGDAASRKEQVREWRRSFGGGNRSEQAGALHGVHGQMGGVVPFVVVHVHDNSRAGAASGPQAAHAATRLQKAGPAEHKGRGVGVVVVAVLEREEALRVVLVHGIRISVSQQRLQRLGGAEKRRIQEGGGRIAAVVVNGGWQFQGGEDAFSGQSRCSADDSTQH